MSKAPTVRQDLDDLVKRVKALEDTFSRVFRAKDG